jgi:Leucine-rich repeat (LRR) protein
MKIDSISDIQDLEKIYNLVFLELIRNRLKDLEGIQILTKLETLYS